MNPQEQKELERLTEGFFRRELDADELAELARRLEEPDARAYYFERAHLESELMQALGADAPESGDRLNRPAAKPRRAGLPRWVLVTFQLILLVGVVLLVRKIVGTSGEMPGPTVAMVTDAPGEVWSGETRVREGQVIALEQGLLGIRMDSQARITVEGPAELRVIGPGLVELIRGKVFVRVPTPAAGFELRHGGNRIIDLGTAFGAAAFEQRFRVGVEAGSVAWTLGDQRLVLKAGQFGTVEGDGVIRLGAGEAPRFIQRPDHRRLVFRSEAGTADVPLGAAFRVSRAFQVHVFSNAEIEGVSLVRDGVPVPCTVSRVALSEVQRFDVMLEGEAGAGLNDGTLRLEAGAAAFSGTLLLSTGWKRDAVAEDFVGSWEYTQGGNYLRDLYADGGSLLDLNGVETAGWHPEKWFVRDGVLVLRLNGGSIVETHRLLDEGTLHFIDKNYEPAVKVFSK